MRICQLQNIVRSLLIASFFVSCSTTKVDERLIRANWLKIPLRFSHRDSNDNYLTHPFFDIDPASIKGRRFVNYFITTPENSLFKYNFDVYSGELYKERDYCPTDDIWESYSRELDRPNFTQGIVPQTYDEKQVPQKIIVFSKYQKEKFKVLPTAYYAARIIGSVLIETCEDYLCDAQSRWTPSQILVAVDSLDVTYAGINLLSELRGVVNWDYVKAFLVNQGGIHEVGTKHFPAYRISKEYGIDDTLKYLDKNAKRVNMKELFASRDACFKLYDDMWDAVENIRTEQYDQETKFLNFFKNFYNKSADQFYQCQKFVRPANINENDRRLWFFAYVQGFINLDKSGFYYKCGARAWSYNPVVDETHYLKDQKNELSRCRARDLTEAFDVIVNGFMLMKSQINKNYRFIEYDTQHGGSHQKIYGWVEDNRKIYACKNAKEPSKENQFNIFPRDVSWPRFVPDNFTRERIIK